MDHNFALSMAFHGFEFVVGNRSPAVAARLGGCVRGKKGRERRPEVRHSCNIN